MAITGVMIRLAVDDLDAAAGFYEQLTGTTARRFSFSGVDLAAVPPFLLLSGENAERFARAATIVVDDLAAQERQLEALGAEITQPIVATPTGQRLVARHPDGRVFEYVATDPA
ncbi:MAG: VOC family protein [Solirubrobacterales bacterium]|nr:VOC family protein [Solirubrobacterales bacterium]